MDNTQQQSLAPPRGSAGFGHSEPFDPPSLSDGAVNGGGGTDGLVTDGVGPDGVGDRSPDATHGGDVASRRSRAVDWFARIGMGVAIAGLLAIVVSAVLPSKWFVEAPNNRLGVDQPAPFAQVPAAASSVDEIIEFGDIDEDVTVYADDGGFYYVTISMPSQTVLSRWVSQGDPTVRFITYEDKFGFQTPSQRRVLSLQSMTTSEQTAQFVALQRLGFDATLRPGAVIVGQVLCIEVNEAENDCDEWPPSDELIDPGDTIIAAAGDPVSNAEDLSAALADKAPGEEIELTVVREDEEISGTIELIGDPEDPDRALIGVMLVDNPIVELPFELEFDTRNTGGPSAGLAFTLALTDELSEGDLTGGANVAVTGTIDVEGQVGPIGGLVQKASAVQQAGIDIFIVPEAQGTEQIEQARSAVDGVTIIPVATYDDALDVLETLGGDPIPEPAYAADE